MIYTDVQHFLDCFLVGKSTLFAPHPTLSSWVLAPTALVPHIMNECYGRRWYRKNDGPVIMRWLLLCDVARILFYSDVRTHVPSNKIICTGLWTYIHIGSEVNFAVFECLWSQPRDIVVPRVLSGIRDQWPSALIQEESINFMTPLLQN